MIGELEGGVDLCPEIAGLLEAGLLDECPLSPRDGGFIRDGFHTELDNLRELARGGTTPRAGWYEEAAASCCARKTRIIVLPEPAARYGEIIRLNPPDFRPSVESFNLSAALASPEQTWAVSQK